MNRKRLEYFLTAAETLNLTETAERRFITQASVSGAVAALEKEQDFQLFDRSRRKLRLTPAGEYFYTVGQNIIEVEDQYIQKARHISASEGATLRIGASYGVCYSNTAKLFSDFKQREPQSEFLFETIDNSALMKKVKSYSLDLALLLHLSELETDRECDEIVLSRSRYGVLVPKGHVLEGEPMVSAEMLREEKLLYPVNYTTASPPTLLGLNQKGIFPERILRGNNVDEIMLTAAVYHWPVLLAEFLAKGIPVPDYTFVPFGSDMPEIELILMKAKGITRPIVQRLFDFFRQEQNGKG